MGQHRIYWGGMLIIIGTLALMGVMGYFTQDHLDVLYTLWPMVLIVFGLNIWLKKFPIVRLILWLGLISVFVYLGNFRASYDFIRPFSLDFANNLPQMIEVEDQVTYRVASDSALEGDLRVDLLRPHLMISSGQTGMTEIIYPSQKLKPETSFKGTVNSIILKGETSQEEYIPIDLRMDPNLPWRVEMIADVLTGTLDFTAIMLEALSLETGAGQFDLVLENVADHATIELVLAAANVNLKIPPEVGYRLSVEGILSNVAISGMYSQTSNQYTSDNYETATKKIEISIENALGNFKIDHTKAH